MSKQDLGILEECSSLRYYWDERFIDDSHFRHNDKNKLNLSQT